MYDYSPCSQLYLRLTFYYIYDCFRPSVCDCCREERYGEGLRVIRPVSKIFGVKNLPFLFRCCSTNCRDTFMSNSESLVNVLYGSDT